MDSIVVIGSSNTDMVIKTDHLPVPGETVTGGEFFVYQGGKGANQAVGVAKLGYPVSMLGNVGDDSFGSALHGIHSTANECGFIESHIGLLTSRASFSSSTKIWASKGSISGCT